MIEKSGEITFIKRLSKSGNSIVLSVPKDIVDFLSLDGRTMVEITLKRLSRTPAVVEEVVRR